MNSAEGNAGETVRFKECITEFMKGAAEMAVELGKGCRDIVKQNLVNEDSYIARKFGRDSYVAKRIRGPCEKLCGKLSFFNEYLPEDKDPLHAWSVIFFVSLIAFAAVYVNFEHDPSTSTDSTPLTKQVFVHPPSANRTLLPDGRYMAYKERGVPADRARFSMIAPHTFLSSRLAGIPGVKDSLLEEFGIHLLTYDLPGFGESDPHPNRNLESSAMDMSFLADALGVNKFWVVGYSSGSMHAWAALRYIPDRLAGAAMVAPMVNPYDPIMTKEEKRRTWAKWTRKRKLMYFLARRLPRSLAFFYQRSFLSGKHGQIDRWLSLSLGTRDKALMEDPIYEEFWQRDVEESIRQGNVKPFVEESALQVSNWGFSLADLKLQKKKRSHNMLSWLKSMFTAEQEEYIGFLGPIHIWQGMDDKVVPPSMTDFVHRILPGAAVHKLPYEGHFTYIYFCDECHRQIFTTLFGTPQGPLNFSFEVDKTTLDVITIEQPEEEVVDSGDSTTD
ncbi:Alpha/Beta hydrolase fold [Senna tora]|uniref:Alpha/Beta hydrolase fold n=1 Tax=Senna tora TaxID=362788 RepID=A0A834SLG4_9FABA|nr:Alpha/Beta hydrolase fold [Senna tora]